MRQLLVTLAALGILFLPLYLHGAKTLPGWLKGAMLQHDEDFEQDADAVCLLDSTDLKYSEQGRLQVVRRQALRILTQDGARHADFHQDFDSSNSQIKELSVWIIRADNKIEKFRRRDCFELSSETVLYTEMKSIVFAGSERVRTGDVIAWEIELFGTTIFPQHILVLEREIPVHHFAVRLKPPRGWSIRSLTVNGDALEPDRSKWGYEWQARLLPGIDPKEELSPDLVDFARILIVAIDPPGDDGQAEPYLLCDDWNAVARYAASNMDSAVDRGSRIARKATSIAGGLDSKWEKVHTLASFVQSLNYASVNSDISKGGGYVPCKAADVLEHGYGDCKDLTTLMRSLLDVSGIRSHAVLACMPTGGSLVVEEWPSIRWFNHCIVGIECSSAPAGWPTVIHPELGPLLIFDPTDKFSPVGAIPPALYGTRILVAHASSNRLLELPTAAVDRDLISNRVEVTLLPTGLTSVAVQARMTGAAGHKYRSWMGSQSSSEFGDSLLDALREHLPGMQATDLKTVALPGTGAFELEMTALIPGHARWVGDKMVVFKPVLFFHNDWVPPDEERRNPIRIRARYLRETTQVHIPQGFIIEEVPRDIHLEESFGKFISSIRIGEDSFSVERRLELKDTLLPSDAYERVRNFYCRMIHFENSPVVLSSAD
jgi:hypothetical protein